MFTVIDSAMTKNRNENATDILPKIRQEITTVIDPLFDSRLDTTQYIRNDLVRVLLKASLCDTSVGGTTSKNKMMGDYDYLVVESDNSKERIPSDE